MKLQDYTDILRDPSGCALLFCNDDSGNYLQSQDGTHYPVNGNIISFLNNQTLTGNNEIYRKMYNRFSTFYDLATQLYAWFRNGNETDRLMQYLSFLKINKGDKVIEISIGTGRNIKLLNPDADYYGVDISNGMLKQCQRKMKHLRRDITLLEAEAESLPVRDESFDVVFSAGGFNFFNNPGKAVSEMLRIAKPGVQILITDETEQFRLKHSKNEFYRNHPIKYPVIYLPTYCENIEYREICDGDLYVLTFQKKR